MKRFKPVSILWLVGFIVSLLLLGASYWPPERQTKSIAVSPDITDSGWLWSAVIEVDYARWMRTGETARLDVTIKPDPESGWQVQRPVVLEIRLEARDCIIQPQGVIAQPLVNEDLFYQWQLLPVGKTSLPATLWINAVWQDDLGAVQRHLLAAPEVQARVVGLPGLSWAMVRGFGWGLMAAIVTAGLVSRRRKPLSLYNREGY